MARPICDRSLRRLCRSAQKARGLQSAAWTMRPFLLGYVVDGLTSQIPINTPPARQAKPADTHNTSRPAAVKAANRASVFRWPPARTAAVSYTHLRAHETPEHL